MKALKSILIAFGLLLLVLAIVAGIKAEQIFTMIKSGESFVPPPESVSVYQAKLQSWPQTYTAIGTVEADEGITISAQVPGKVKRIAFQSGAYVQAGEVLVEQEAVNEKAQLDAAQARLKLAQASYQRLVELRKRNIASQSELDTAVQQVESAKGDVDDLRATLEKKQIRAPFDGRVGIRQVDLGTDLQVGTAIVSLQATNRVRVNFPIPQGWLSQISRGLDVSVAVGDAEGSTVAGKITAIGTEINPTTRNAMVQSSLDNADNKLMPGMAVSTTVTLSEPLQVLAVPSTAVIYAPFGDTVFVADKDEKTGALKARQQFVRLGQSRGDFVEVLDGIKAGESVVSAGAFKLFNNQALVITDKPTPEFKTDPTPADS
ncbi:efflux RND transporter periplasmic adaptor subunit [Rheinheimera sp.]|uniref:efflux RND transporter periplasmic adaptor subunit n=1 Tax=Rheinheimera sp. TaxID=1869214 RepID=UPI0027B96912|nr:efflux RND transporter periplasmic adaptor subunit [Rheinheimera sp.]